jgi:hypothetical protein
MRVLWRDSEAGRHPGRVWMLLSRVARAVGTHSVRVDNSAPLKQLLRAWRWLPGLLGTFYGRKVSFWREV